VGFFDQLQGKNEVHPLNRKVARLRSLNHSSVTKVKNTAARLNKPPVAFAKTIIALQMFV
jgi:hypothetical protein